MLSVETWLQQGSESCGSVGLIIKHFLGYCCPKKLGVTWHCYTLEQTHDGPWTREQLSSCENAASASSSRWARVLVILSPRYRAVLRDVHSRSLEPSVMSGTIPTQAAFSNACLFR